MHISAESLLIILVASAWFALGGLPVRFADGTGFGIVGDLIIGIFWAPSLGPGCLHNWASILVRE